MAYEALRAVDSCHRYEAKKSAENESIANWFIHLTDVKQNWGFGLRYLHLRNVKDFKWSHKRIYRIYKALEFSPRKRLVRDMPDALIVPLSISQPWSMNFTHDQMQDSGSICLFSINDDFN